MDAFLMAYVTLALGRKGANGKLVGVVVPVGVPTIAASHFTLALSALSGQPGATFQVIASPVSGAWPSGQQVTATVSNGTVGSGTQTASGTAPVTFNITAGAAGNTVVTVAALNMTNDTGPEQFAVVPAPSLTATRYDAVFGASSGPAGTAQTVTLIPNGPWPSAAGAITAAVSKGSGTFPDGATVSYSPGSTTAATLRYTPGASGEHALSLTNNAGLYNPYNPPLNCWAASSGTAQTLSVAATKRDNAGFQRDTVAGSPRGTNFSWARGWGEMAVNVSAIGGATNGLFARLVDVDSSRATSAVGTGTYLDTAPWQVYGPVSGTGVVTLLLPAGPYFMWLELATDAAFTNPVRLANRFGVGIVTAVLTRSQESGIGRGFQYGSGDNPANVVAYDKISVLAGSAYQYSYTDNGTFYRPVAGTHDGNFYSEPASAGTQEWGRLIMAQFGVVSSIVGNIGLGGNTNESVGHDGSLQFPFTGSLDALTTKFQFLFANTGGWSDSNYPESIAEYRTRFTGVVPYTLNRYKACSVIGWCTGMSGTFGSDGARATGYSRVQMIWLNEIEPSQPAAVSKENCAWSGFNGGHSDMGSRVQYARTSARLMFSAVPTAMGGNQGVSRGPTLTGTCTLSRATRVLRLFGKLNGAGAVRGIVVASGGTNYAYNAASAADLAYLVSIYQSGGMNGAAGNLGKAIKITGVAISTSNLPAGADFAVEATLFGSSGITYADGTTDTLPSTLTAHYLGDYGASSAYAGNGCPVICDDRTDLGIAMGWGLRGKLDIPVSVS